ncbi:MAG: hydrolase [Parcubacteria group bacterium]|nr:hydrolase [Parcubacteria group bacterium]
MTKFFIKYIDDGNVIPEKESISSVFLIATEGSKILAIHNDRGWEIPGGHIEGEETPEEALVREVEEEAGASFSHERPFAFIESDDQDAYKDKVMLIYETKNFELGTFTPSEDAFGREVIEIEEFLKRYKGRIDFVHILSRFVTI